MSMSASALSASIKSKLESKIGVSEPNQLQELSDAIAEAVVDHITTNAEVNGGTCAPSGPIAGGKIT